MTFTILPKAKQILEELLRNTTRVSHPLHHHSLHQIAITISEWHECSLKHSIEKIVISENTEKVSTMEIGESSWIWAMFVLAIGLGRVIMIMKDTMKNVMSWCHSTRERSEGEPI